MGRMSTIMSHVILSDIRSLLVLRYIRKYEFLCGNTVQYASVNQSSCVTLRQSS